MLRKPRQEILRIADWPSCDCRDCQLWTMVDDHTPDPNNPRSTCKTYTFNTDDNRNGTGL